MFKFCEWRPSVSYSGRFSAPIDISSNQCPFRSKKLDSDTRPALFKYVFILRKLGVTFDGVGADNAQKSGSSGFIAKNGRK